ncbi:carbohydrate ABC transporter permease [Kitasatospora sp. NPDC088346]|uniref:carbohydrate ABC transporter permease n=1 Tax=Kitasatospora sp. NPDC088346 TaxID=3364073 RepID=UPI003816ABBA
MNPVPRRTAGRPARTAALCVLGLAVAAVWAFPVYWMALTAFEPGAEIRAATPRFWPRRPTWEHFAQVTADPLFWHAVRNSAVVTGATVVLAMAVALGSALAVARFRFRGRGLYVAAVMLVQMVPHVALVIPIFLTLGDVGLSDSIPGLVVTYLAFVLPFAVWTLRGFVAAVPRELEEAAMVDGCGRAAVFRRVVLPLALPGLVATSVYAMVLAWNEYLFAYFLLGTPDQHTVPLWLTHFVTTEGTDYGALMAGSTIVALPVVVFFLLVQRHLAGGLTAGAVKG